MIESEFDLLARKDFVDFVQQSCQSALQNDDHDAGKSD